MVIIIKTIISPQLKIIQNNRPLTFRIQPETNWYPKFIFLYSIYY